jgi:hypothetical protein
MTKKKRNTIPGKHPDEVEDDLFGSFLKLGSVSFRSGI